MLHGKFWITPEGLFDVARSEHALFAKKYLLGLPRDDRHFTVKDMLSALTPADRRYFSRRGIAADIIEFLSR